MPLPLDSGWDAVGTQGPSDYISVTEQITAPPYSYLRVTNPVDPANLKLNGS